MIDKMLRYRRIVILFVIAFFLVAAMSVYTLFVFSARDAANATIMNADDIIKQATLAALPGSDVENSLIGSAMNLNKVREDYNSTSFFSINKYGEIRFAADAADDFALSILDGMKAEYAIALEALFQLDFEPAFAFYRKHPRTYEAVGALTSAELTMSTRIGLLSIGNDFKIKTVEQISQFQIAWPKAERSQSVIEETGNLLVDEAFRNIILLEPIVKNNRESLEKVVSTSGRQRFLFMSSDVVSVSNTINSQMPNLFMPLELQQLFSVLVDANNLSKEFEATIQGIGLDQNEIISLSTINDNLEQKLTEAKTLLEIVKTRYYTGSSSTQAGMADAVKARSGT